MSSSAIAMDEAVTALRVSCLWEAILLMQGALLGPAKRISGHGLVAEACERSPMEVW